LNYLAHSLFSNSDEFILVGQYCGDFVRGSDLDHYPDGIHTGILWHRRIDSFTDQHPANLRARNYFAKPHRRFAGIITDVLYDHFLAQNWHHYCDTPLQSHVGFVHKALQQHVDLMPPRLQRFSQIVVEQNALMSYLQFDSVEQVLQRISQRSPRFLPLASAGDPLREHQHALKACFDEFFPDLVSHMNTVIKLS